MIQKLKKGNNTQKEIKSVAEYLKVNTIQVIHFPLRSIAILLAMLCIFAPSVDARTISLEEAKAKAQRFYANAKDPALRARGLSAPEFKLAYEAKTANKTASRFYVLNQPSSQGFIIISADDRLPEVLGYSDSGDFDINQIPDNMKWWLSEYEHQIEQVLSSADADIAESTEHREGWTPIEPLVKTEWNQGAPYNNLCPTIDGQRCLTGCVATAMAQIMSYHQWPATGRGSRSYDWNGQTLSMDFSTVTFDWANMQDIYSGSSDSPEAQNAVATLMLACGISIYMMYGVNESGAYSHDVFEALYDYFDYDADYLERDGVELPYWEKLIYNELVNHRPVHYLGHSEKIGHAFVCDGYSTDGLFHINWGWGYGGGYYLLNVLGSFNYDQDIVYGISPINKEEAMRNGIDINAENFPDDNFRNCLLENDYGRDGVLTEAEIRRMVVYVPSKNISNLKGLEYLTVLKYLSCNDNQLTALDVSQNMALQHLYCERNQLTSLDVSKNTILRYLYCYNNQLTSLDVSKNTALKLLYFQYNQLTSLDVSKNTALEGLNCLSNQLTSLDVSKNMELKYLYCSDNQLTSLDVSKNTALNVLYCNNNQLTSLDVSQNMVLEHLYCNDNQLTALDVSKNTALATLQCYNNQLTALDISGCTALENLDCSNNPLTSLNCSRSNFKRDAMDNIINQLPQNTTNEICKFYVYDDSYADEGNICTKEQVAAIKSKGWTPYYFDATDKVWKEYEGEDLDDILARKKAKAEAAYQDGMAVYEQCIFYYEGDGMAYYKQVAEKAAGNRSKAEHLLTDIAMLEKKIAESGMTEEAKAEYIKTLNDIKANVSALLTENDDPQTSNQFYEKVQMNFGLVSAYQNRLVQYKDRVESTTTVEELNTLIGEMGKDAEETKYSCLESVVSDYEALKLIEPRLVEIGKELDDQEVRLQLFSDEVNTVITGISGIYADAESIIVYTISGKRLVMKKSDLEELPKGLYIVNSRKHVVK